MAVDSALLWSLAGLGVGSVVVATVLGLRRRRSRPEQPGVIGDHEVLMYLNETIVMDVLQYRGNVPALKQQVERYTRDTAEGRAEAKSRWFSFSGSRGHENQTTRVFEAVEEPITAIRKVVEALEAADAIVYADLHKGEVHAHRSLDGGTVDQANLSDITMFLSVTGPFESYEERDGSDKDYLRLRAPYPGGNAHVRIKIARSGLRENDVVLERNAAFRGRVLGKVENWDEPNRVLKMWAMAIFR